LRCRVVFLGPVPLCFSQRSSPLVSILRLRPTGLTPPLSPSCFGNEWLCDSYFPPVSLPREVTAQGHVIVTFPLPMTPVWIHYPSRRVDFQPFFLYYLLVPTGVCSPLPSTFVIPFLPLYKSAWNKWVRVSLPLLAAFRLLTSPFGHPFFATLDTSGIPFLTLVFLVC